MTYEVHICISGYIPEVRVKFVYEGHQVIGPRSRSQEQKDRQVLFPPCKLRSPVTPVLEKIESLGLRVAVTWGFRYSGSSGVTAIFATRQEVTTPN